jgi:ribonuclease HI
MPKTKPPIKQQRRPPESGMHKLNVDGAFSSDGRAGAGMVLRDTDGAVIFAACRCLKGCADALDAELQAMEEGLELALRWSTEAFILESDCAEAISLVSEGSSNMSRYARRITIIRDKIRERELRVLKVGRVANTVSHGLAFIGRVQERSTM